MGPRIVLSHLLMDVCVTINMSDTHFVFSISVMIFCFSILFLTSKYLIIYYITKDDDSLIHELEEIYIYFILYVTIYIYISLRITKNISYYILQKLNKLHLIYNLLVLLVRKLTGGYVIAAAAVIIAAIGVW
jgi:hypothetical protein